MIDSSKNHQWTLKITGGKLNETRCLYSLKVSPSKLHVNYKVKNINFTGLETW